MTVLPSTDLYLMGRNQRHSAVRGVLAAHELLRFGVNCSLSTNNVLNPFTPFGDCSLVRMANLYANCCHAGTREDMRECLAMVTDRSARLMRLRDYGIEVGKPADLVVLDCEHPAQAVAELAAPLLRIQARAQDVYAPAGRVASAVAGRARRCAMQRAGCRPRDRPPARRRRPRRAAA